MDTMQIKDSVVFTYDGNSTAAKESLERLQYYALRFSEGTEKLFADCNDEQGKEFLYTYGPRFVAEWYRFLITCQAHDQQKFRAIQDEMRKMAQEMHCHAATVLASKEG